MWSIMWNYINPIFNLFHGLEVKAPKTETHFHTKTSAPNLPVTVCVCISQQCRTQTASYLGGMHRAQVCSGTTRRALVEKVWVHRCQVNRGSGPQFHSLHHHYSRSMHRLQVLLGHSQRERCNMTTVIQTYPISKYSFWFLEIWRLHIFYSCQNMSYFVLSLPKKPGPAQA